MVWSVSNHVTENPMNSRFAKALLTITAVTALAAPAAAQARHGADDPVGHVRHSPNEVHRSQAAERRHARSVARHARHGADDGPAHA